jgi:hypothetical protein
VSGVEKETVPSEVEFLLKSERRNLWTLSDDSQDRASSCAFDQLKIEI